LMRLNRSGRQMAAMREGTTTSSPSTPLTPLQNHASLGRFIQPRKRLNAARASSKTSTVSASFNLLFICLPLSTYGYTDDGMGRENQNICGMESMANRLFFGKIYSWEADKSLAPEFS